MKARMLTVSAMKENRQRIPYIRLIGIWVKAAGISPADKIIVTNPQPGQIIITVKREDTRP